MPRGMKKVGRLLASVALRVTSQASVGRSFPPSCLYLTNTGRGLTGERPWEHTDWEKGR